MPQIPPTPSFDGREPSMSDPDAPVPRPAARQRPIDLAKRPERAVIVGLYAADGAVSPDRLLDELESLVHAARGEVVARVFQRRSGKAGDFGLRDRPVDPATYVGRGKVDEVAEAARAQDADVVVFDNDLTPAQIRELEKRIGKRVIDRSELILDIFASRARTRAARLQVELAQLAYTAPRLRGMWSHLERQGGGAGGGSQGMGTRGPGEQQVEIDRRIIQKRLAHLQAELKVIADRREREVDARTRKAWSVGLVGYTNAGKSTLFNALTGSRAFAADLLFATLDTTLRRWEVSPGVAIPLADTVGFVRDLPHHLVESFRSTLSETLYAELLLHVVDASHPEARDQVRAVNAVLEELGVPAGKVLGVLNKVDAVTDPDVLFDLRTQLPGSLAVSALTGEGLPELTAEVARRRSADWAEIRLFVPHADARQLALVHETGEVRAESWSDEGWTAEVAVPRSVLPRLQAWVRG